MCECHPCWLSLLGLPRGEVGAGPCAAGAEGPRWAPVAALLQYGCFSPGISSESPDLEQKYLLLSVSLMASFCGKQGPLGDCTPGCAVTCSCLVSIRLRQTWEKAQPLPGEVLGEKNLFTDAESLFLCEVPPARSDLFPRVAVGSFCGSWGTTGSLLRVPAPPGCGSQCGVPACRHGPGNTASVRGLCWLRAWPGGHGPGDTASVRGLCWLRAWPRGHSLRLWALLGLSTALAAGPAGTTAVPTLGSAAWHNPAALQARRSCVSAKADPLVWVPQPPVWTMQGLK